ncbi:hypothetical protein Xsto_03161 [Xenorhabdus stockiae]|uniref:Uncharacterized protein n=1 Tax=Xenorhabdus stockiae TaxID=351614 RepID=A0A2D0KLB3_9GAMM|nr:hypothetical protein [Xenorhabdus stockiae]PHM64229.1 hypothetical protein Xsto_03161 [Xenorhabdus stockiae]
MSTSICIVTYSGVDATNYSLVSGQTAVYLDVNSATPSNFLGEIESKALHDAKAINPNVTRILIDKVFQLS